MLYWMKKLQEMRKCPLASTACQGDLVMAESLSSSCGIMNEALLLPICWENRDMKR
jgi:hypothetical protein